MCNCIALQNIISLIFYSHYEIHPRGILPFVWAFNRRKYSFVRFTHCFPLSFLFIRYKMLSETACFYKCSRIHRWTHLNELHGNSVIFLAANHVYYMLYALFAILFLSLSHRWMIVIVGWMVLFLLFLIQSATRMRTPSLDSISYEWSFFGWLTYKITCNSSKNSSSTLTF